MNSNTKNLHEIPVTALYGVGGVKAKAYAAAGVHSILDLLYYFPRAYENRGDIRLLEETNPEMKSAVVLTVATEPKVANIKRGMSLLKFRAFDESGICDVTYFNQNYLKDKFPIGSTFRFYGKVEKKGKKFELSSPAAEKFDEEHPEKLPPFVSVRGLGETAAHATVEQRKGKSFISIEEFATCCNKLSKTHIEQLKGLGAFAGMAETSQITFF